MLSNIALYITNTEISKTITRFVDMSGYEKISIFVNIQYYENRYLCDFFHRISGLA